MHQERTVAILAGGASRRMGRDKAALVVEDAPLLERTVRAALAVARTVLIVGRPRPEDWPLPEVRFVEDRVANAGPLAGLAAALETAGGSDVLTVACDMPRLTAEALRWLLEAAEVRPLRHGLVVTNGGQIEPLFSVYTPRCLPLIESHLAMGRRSLHALIGAGDFDHLPAPPPIAAALLNVNTPEEWRAFRQGNDSPASETPSP